MKLTKAETERLVLLIEECGEVVQAATKILRHGFDTGHPEKDAQTNRGQLTDEIGDVLAAVELVCHAGDVQSRDVYIAKNRKLLRVVRYLHARENRTRVENIVGKVDRKTGE